MMPAGHLVSEHMKRTRISWEPHYIRAIGQIKKFNHMNIHDDGMVHNPWFLNDQRGIEED